jgi:holo-[acyl-carrier protein] synthase
VLFSRRSIFARLLPGLAGGAAASAVLPVSASAITPVTPVQKVVYHLSEPTRVNFVMGNIKNHIVGKGGPDKVKMIIGIGSDLIDIRRVEKSLGAFRRALSPSAAFTEIEQQKSDRRANRAASYAKRFAAKEACSKALGTGIAQGRLLEGHGRRQSAERQADDEADRWRRPMILQSMLPAGHQAAIHLTITDDFPLGAGLRDYRSSA